MPSQLLGQLNIKLGLDAKKFNKALSKAEKDMSKLGRSMENIGKNLSLSITAPLVGLGASIVKTAGNFEASMNRVGAITGATGKEFDALSVKAKQLGASTQFSASQSADAIEVLAKNGLNATQILDGAVDASLNLAAATGSDLAGAADIATDVMKNFGKEAKQLGSLINGITGVTLKSKFSIEDYRLALGQAGGVAGTLGVSIEDFNTAIAATSSVFASGSDAGTSFKTFLQRLVPASKEAKEEMEKLGLEFFDSQGKMKSLADISQELQDAFKGLSDEQKNQAASTIFGSDALRTALALADTGSSKFRELSSAIETTSAADQAAARMKGFNGAIKRLQSAFEGLQIAIAESGLLDIVTNFVTKISGYVSQLAAADKGTLRWATALGALAAALGPVTIVLGKFVSGTLPFLTKGFSAFGLALLPIVAKIALIGAAIGGLVLLGKSIIDTWDGVRKFFVIAWARIVDTFTKAFEWIKDSIKEFAEFVGIETNFDKIKENAKEAFGDTADIIESFVGEGKLSELGDNLKKDFNGFIDFAKSGIGDLNSQLNSLFNAGSGGVSPIATGGSPQQEEQQPFLIPPPSEETVSGYMLLSETIAGINTGLQEQAIITNEELGAALDSNAAKYERNNKLLVEQGKIAQKAMGAFIQGASQGAQAADNLGKSVLNAMRNSVKGLLLQGIAGIVSNALATLPPLAAIPIAAGLGAGASALFDKLIPQFAEGGIVSSATLGIFGEAGTEAVMPLDRLNDFIQPQQVILNGNLKVSGSDLQFVLDENARNEQFTF